VLYPLSYGGPGRPGDYQHDHSPTQAVDGV
jgi:hypothetical protein